MLAVLKNPTEPIEGKQQQWSMFQLVRRNMVIYPAPFSDGCVDLPQTLVSQAEIEMGMHEIRSQLNGPNIGLLCAGYIVFVGKNNTEIEVSEMIVRGMVALQPGLVKHSGQRRLSIF